MECDGLLAKHENVSRITDVTAALRQLVRSIKQHPAYNYAQCACDECILLRASLSVAEKFCE